MTENNIRKNSEGLSTPILVLIIVVATLLVGSVGYALGANNAEESANKKNSVENAALEKELEEAKAAASGKVEQGQQDVAEGQQTLESVQAENAQLKQTIEQQNQKIVDLEKQLEEAKTGSTPPQQ